MKKKVLFGYIIAAIVMMLAFEYSFWTNGFRYLEHQSEHSYLVQTELLRDLFLEGEVAGRNTEEENTFEEFTDTYAEEYDIRITVIDEAGNVLANPGGPAI